MGVKEVAATAPLMILLYDRAFVSDSFKKAFARRWRFYVPLAGTWVIYDFDRRSQGEVYSHRIES